MLSKFGAVRTRNARQDMVYCLPAELSVPTAKSPLKQLVLDIEHNSMMIIIRTSPGAAQLIARLLDSLSKSDGVLGTIAGDDTIWEEEPMEILAKQGDMSSFKHDGFWQPMDTLRDKNYLEKLWNTGKAPWKVW